MGRVNLTDKLHCLLQKSGGGLFSASPIISTNSDEPRMIVRVAEMGNIGMVWPEIGKRGNVAANIRAGGTGLDDEAALVPTLAEGLERYSMCVFRSEQFLWASAEELGRDAVDLDTLPRCSPTERSHPKCPLVLPDRTAQIRWVKGLSILDGRVVFIPAVMVYSHVGYAVPEERFWLPISTGCAAHSSYESALLSGIYEVAERDAISLTWLQRLPLPRIDIDYIPLPLAPYWERYMKASSDLEYLFFDATTDLNIPTVYGLQIAPHNNRLTTLVACSTGITIVDALCKVMRDLAALRLAFRKELPTPKSWDDFTELLHGATFMAKAESACAFHFLTQSGSSKRLSEIQHYQSKDVDLRTVVARLKLKGLDTYVVDLSTDEAIRSGMRVVRVIIPGLQPLSLRHRARFLAHSRLYAAPALMGYPTHSEEDLNHWPQPFA